MTGPDRLAHTIIPPQPNTDTRWGSNSAGPRQSVPVQHSKYILPPMHQQPFPVNIPLNGDAEAAVHLSQIFHPESVGQHPFDRIHLLKCPRQDNQVIHTHSHDS
jgi:hypothetical protein